jgi:hypothetical protein
MRRSLRIKIKGVAWHLLEEGTVKTWDEARAIADAQTRCNAKTRKGTPCQARGLGKGDRCKFHGGLSTGPLTPEGKAKTLAALQAGYRRWLAAKKAAP